MWTCWILLAGLVLGAAYISPQVIRIVQENRLRTRCRMEHALVLTYDDGPGSVLTPRLLDVLAANEATATFFILGQPMQAAPDLLHRMRDEGHELASHSYAHLNAWKVFPWRSFVDVQRGFEALAAQGIDFKLFRPPYGKLNLLTWMAATWRGIQLGWWTVVSGDTFQPLPDPTSVLRTVESDEGGIVLMHDFNSSEERSAYVLDLTKRLLDTARLRGWKVCTLSQLLRIQ